MLQHSQVFLVLCGSYLSIMERDILNREAPLYGRRTAQWVLRPLTPRQCRDFFPQATPTQLIELYAITGGMPAYLAQFSPDRSLWTNLSQTAFDPTHILYNDGLTLLRDELRHPRHYAAILRAIANGNHTLSPIAGEAGVDHTSLSPYLATLQGAGYVDRRLPVGIQADVGRRHGKWHLADPYIRFWGRYILPYTGAIERNQGASVVEQVVRPSWEQFVAITWEELARMAVYELAPRVTPGFWPEAVGSWWDRTHQIDVAAVNYGERIAWLGEARWRDQAMGMADLAALKIKAAAWQGETTGWRIYHALFSRSGFTDELQQAAQRNPEILLFNPTDIVGI